MSAWWSHLRGRPLYWALDESHPAAALLVLREVLGRPGQAPALQAARLALREWPPIRRLVDSLNEGWDEGTGALPPLRYRAPLWRLRLLAELGVPGDELAIAEATDRLLATRHRATRAVNFDAVLLSIPLSFGYGADPRVERRLDRLIGAVRAARWPTLPTARADWLAQAIATLSLAVRAGLIGGEACEAAARALLAQPLPGGRWLRLGFPVFDRPDVLFAARHLLLAGIRDERLRPWVETVVEMQEPGGGWHLRRDLQREAGLVLESPQKPSRWLTAQGLYVLRAFYGE